MFCYDGLRCFVPTDILLRASYFLFTQYIFETKPFQYGNNYNNIVEFFFDKSTTIRYLTIFEFGILIWWHLRKSNVWKVNKAMALIYQSIVQISALFACPTFVCIWFRWKNYLKGFNLRPSIFPHFLLFKVFVHLRVHYCLDWFMNGPNFLCLLFCPKKNKVNNKRECIPSIESSCTICTESEWNEWDDVAFVILSRNIVLEMYSITVVF